MFENSSEETAYHKLLILYILYKIKMDLTNSQIWNDELLLVATTFISTYGIKIFKDI